MNMKRNVLNFFDFEDLKVLHRYGGLIAVNIYVDIYLFIFQIDTEDSRSIVGSC